VLGDTLGALHLGVAWAVGFVLIASGVAKAADRTSFAQALAGYGVSARRGRESLEIAIPSIEIALGISWLITWDVWLVAIATIGLLAVFSGAAIAGRGSAASCGCGGVFADGPAGWNVVIRNVVLLVIVLGGAMVAPTTGFSIDTFAAAATVTLALLTLLIGLDALLVAELRLRDVEGGVSLEHDVSS